MDKLRSMNPEQVASLLRTILQVGGTALATTGYLSTSQIQSISGMLVVVLVTIWGLWARKDTNLLASAAAVPGVTSIAVSSPAVASAVPDPKVRSTVLSIALLCLIVGPMLLALPACQSTAAGSTLTLDNTRLSALVAKAQAYAKVACSIVPTASSIANIFAAEGGTVATAEQVASLLCSALTVGTAYAADDAEAQAKRKPKKGETVTGTVVVNGKPVPVSGTVAK